MDAIEQRWQEWRAQNPYALTMLAMLARDLLAEEAARGRRPMLSAKLLFELARFRGLLDVTTTDGYAWNNSYTALAARALVRIAPDLKDRFRFRERAVELEAIERETAERNWAGDLFA